MDEQIRLIEAFQCEDGIIENTEYSECEFSKCVFANVTLRNAVFSNCVFTDSILRNVTFCESSMLNGTFECCALMGLDWSVLRRHDARLPLLTAIRSCALKYNTFMGMKMDKMDFSDSTLYDCFFQECGLKQTDFRRCDLENTVFQNCNVAKADFRDARKYRINVMNNIITKAKFSLPDAIGLLDGFDIVIEP